MSKLGDYEAWKNSFLKAAYKAKPYTGIDPNSYGFTSAQMEVMGGDANPIRQAEADRNQYDLGRLADWSATLTPQQRQEYFQLKDQAYNKNKRLGQMAFLGAVGGMAAPGLLGAMGAEGAGAGAGAYGAGSGWGADTLSAMGLGDGAAGAGAAGAGAAGTGAAGGGAMSFIPGADSAASGYGFASNVPSWAQGAAGLGGGGGGGDNLLQTILKGVGSLTGGDGGGGTNWTNLLGNLLGGYLQSRASGKATDALVNAGNQSNALLEQMWQQSRADQAPYREAGTSALAGIQALLKNPNSITTMPDYQFGLDQGSKALQNSASARGMTYSGQQAKALERYGNDYAGTKLNESYNRLAGLAGIGQQATNQTGAMGQGYGSQMANTIQGIGNARGSGYIGQGNAWNSAIGGSLNGLNEQNLINALLKQRGGG